MSTNTWRAGVESSIRRIEAMQRKPRDLWHPAYFAALEEALVYLRSMLERGGERSGDIPFSDDKPLMLVFDSHGDYTPDSMAKLLAGQEFGGDRNRPYDGQPWTALGERGRVPIAGLTVRDAGDCVARGAAYAGHDVCTSVIQASLCEIEKMMGTFPNVPAGPVVIPMLVMPHAPCDHVFCDADGNRVYLYCQRGCGARDPLVPAMNNLGPGKESGS